MGGRVHQFYPGKSDFPHISLLYLYIYIYVHGIPVHVAVKTICLTIGLWIFLRKDNVLLFLQYDTGEWSICLWCLYLYICTGISLYFLFEQWRDHSVLWQCWWGVHLPLVSTCFLYALVFPYIFLISWPFWMGSHWQHWKWCLYLYICTGISLYFLFEQWRDHSVLWQCWWGVHLLWCLYLYICTGISLYFLIEQWRDHSVLWQWWQGGPSAFSIYMFSLCTGISLYFLISWLFQMGSHWLHCKAKSSLWALAVSNGGFIIRFTWCHTDISLYLPIIWLFQMGTHWPHWKANSSLWALAVSNGRVLSFTQVNLKFWAPKCLGVLINKVFSLYAKTNNLL